jgi:hypothetical protein
MSEPTQFHSPPKKPARDKGSTLLFVALGVAGVSLACCGGIGVAVLLLFTMRDSTRKKVQAAIEDQLPAQLVPQRWEEDWMTMEQLTRGYTTALDAVTADKRVIERLGDDIEAIIGNNDKLFRRERTGRLSQSDEPIEFDVKGPKGTATVRVVCTAAQGLPGSFPWSRPTKITVKFKDDAELDVPPPAEKNQIEP